MTAPKTWGKGYVMVPGWLVKKKPSANAVLVYVHLGMHGSFNSGEGRYEQCKPSKKTLAKGDPKRGYPGCGLSEATIGRALRELEDLRAIKGEEAYDGRGGQLPTVYRLIFGELNEEEESAAQTPIPLVIPPSREEEESAAQTPISPVIPPSRVTDENTQGGYGSDTQGGYKSDTPGGVSDLIHHQEEELELEPKNQKTPVVPAADPPPAPAVAESATGETSLDNETRAELNDAITVASQLRASETSWSVGAIRSAVRAALDGGHPADPVLDALRQFAADLDGTRSPRRIKAFLDERAKQAAAAPEPPGWATSRNAELRPDVDRCRLHRGQPAHGCNQCLGEAKGVDVDGGQARGPALSAAEARAFARKVARPRKPRTASVPVVPDQQPAPSLVALAQAVEMLAETVAA